MNKELKVKIHGDVARAIEDAEGKARFETFAFEAITWGETDIQRIEEKGDR